MELEDKWARCDREKEREQQLCKLQKQTFNFFGVKHSTQAVERQSQQHEKFIYEKRVDSSAQRYRLKHNKLHSRRRHGTRMMMAREERRGQKANNTRIQQTQRENTRKVLKSHRRDLEEKKKKNVNEIMKRVECYKSDLLLLSNVKWLPSSSSSLYVLYVSRWSSPSQAWNKYYVEIAVSERLWHIDRAFSRKTI